jgi:hypothetical protein
VKFLRRFEPVRRHVGFSADKPAKPHELVKAERTIRCDRLAYAIPEVVVGPLGGRAESRQW